MRMNHVAQIDEEQRQVVLLALAKLSIERPGWVRMIRELALKMDNRTAKGEPQMLEELRRTHAADAKKELARMTVAALYSSFNVVMLEEILAIGRKYEAETDREEVLCMNEALAEEIASRKARR